MPDIPRRQHDDPDTDWRPRRRVDPEAWDHRRLTPPWMQPALIVILAAGLTLATTLALAIRQDALRDIRELRLEQATLRQDLSHTRARQDWVIGEVGRLRDQSR